MPGSRVEVGLAPERFRRTVPALSVAGAGRSGPVRRTFVRQWRLAGRGGGVAGSGGWRSREKLEMRLMRRSWITIVPWLLIATSLSAVETERDWEEAERHESDGSSLTLFVDREPRPGRPAFKIETRFEASPPVAAATVMHGMTSDEDLPSGERRRLLERSEREAVVYTFIDLPFMLADRELALRVVHTDDAESGIHRVAWSEANENLPPSRGRVVRLDGAVGYWEFRPDGEGGSYAIYMSQTEVGGSIPDAIADRLMKSQAMGSVERLRRRIRDRQRTHVAGGPPPSGSASKETRPATDADSP
jgi:hypothetical protein